MPNGGKEQLMGSETGMLRTADGRELEVLVSGPEDGFPLVFFPWTPAAAVPSGLRARGAAAGGIRLVSSSRPG